MDLIKLETQEVPQLPAALEGSTFYFPRVSISSANSKTFTEFNVPLGHWALTNRESVDLGPEIDALVIAVRGKAMRFGSMVINYEPDSETFKQIMAESTVKDSGSVYGPEYLLYLAGQSFATYFCSSVSARNESPEIRKHMYKAVTLKSRLITKPYRYFVPIASECPTFSEIPEPEAINDAYERYMSLKSSEVEIVKEANDTNR
jgi:hypothetical protein